MQLKKTVSSPVSRRPISERQRSAVGMFMGSPLLRKSMVGVVGLPVQPGAKGSPISAGTDNVNFLSENGSSAVKISNIRELKSAARIFETIMAWRYKKRYLIFDTVQAQTRMEISCLNDEIGALKLENTRIHSVSDLEKKQLLEACDKDTARLNQLHQVEVEGLNSKIKNLEDEVVFQKNQNRLLEGMINELKTKNEEYVELTFQQEAVITQFMEQMTLIAGQAEPFFEPDYEAKLLSGSEVERQHVAILKNRFLLAIQGAEQLMVTEKQSEDYAQTDLRANFGTPSRGGNGSV